MQKRLTAHRMPTPTAQPHIGPCRLPQQRRIRRIETAFSVPIGHVDGTSATCDRHSDCFHGICSMSDMTNSNS